MEITDPSEPPKHEHKWLEWLGLEEPPPGPDSWVPVVNGIALDGSGDRPPVVARRLIVALKAAGIEGRTRRHEFLDDTHGGGLWSVGVNSAYVAVLVQESDLSRAVEVAHTFERQPGVTRGDSGISDDELTRMALEAGPPPPE